MSKQLNSAVAQHTRRATIVTANITYDGFNNRYDLTMTLQLHDSDEIILDTVSIPSKSEQFYAALEGKPAYWTHPEKLIGTEVLVTLNEWMWMGRARQDVIEYRTIDD